MERCSTPVINKKMQIKTTRKHHFTPLRRAILKKTKDNKGWQRYGEKKENICTLLVGKQIGTPTMKNSTEFPQKTKNRTTI